MPLTERASSASLIDEKLARGGLGDKSSSQLPLFIQKRIKFVEAKRHDERLSATATGSSSYRRDSEHKKTSEKVAASSRPQPKLSMEWQRIGPIGPGLSNLGNTCFLNSVLQCLIYTAPLSNSLLSDGQDHARQCRMSGGFCLYCEMHRLAHKCLSPGVGRVVTPSQIVSRLRSIGKQFRMGRQEDAHEFLRLVIDALQKACLGGREERDVPAEQRTSTLIHRIFGGRLESLVTCLSCKHESRTVEAFLDLSLEVRQAASIWAALDQFTAVERLSQATANRYRCEACGQLVAATKQFRLLDLPNILTIHLKRFQMTPYGEPSKVGREVSFTPVLRHSNCLYDLYAVLVHEGQTCHSGHYHCFVRASNGSWYSMNDESVHQVGLATVLKQKAYLLFYQRRTEPTEELEVVAVADEADAEKENVGNKRKSTEIIDSRQPPPPPRSLPTPPPEENEKEKAICPSKEPKEINIISKSWWHLNAPTSSHRRSNNSKGWSVTPL